MTTKITITRALTRIKTITDQLDKLSYMDDELVKSVLQSKEKDNQTKQFITDSQSKFDKFNSLYSELLKLKDGIQQSNAVTKVKIAGEELLVQSAIFRKEAISKKKEFFIKLQNQHLQSIKSVETAETKIEEKARQFVENLKIEKTSKEELEQALQIGRNSAIQDTRRIIVSGFKLDQIQKELDSINAFLEEVDYALSESNAITMIEV